MSLIEIVLAVTLCLFGFNGLRRLMSLRAVLATSDLCPIFTALYFGLSPLLGGLLAPPRVEYADPQSRELAYLSVLLCVITQSLAARLLRRRRASRDTRDLAIQTDIGCALGGEDLRPLGIIACALFVWTIRGVLAISYGILISGSATESAVRGLPYQVVVASSFGNLIGAGLVALWSMHALDGKSTWMRWLSRAALAAEVPYRFLRGRRELVELIVVPLLVHLLRSKRRRLVGMLIGGTSAIVAVFILGPILVAVRDERAALDGADHLSAAPMLTEVLGTGLRAAGDNAGFSDYKSDVSERLMIINWNAMIVTAQDRTDPQLGRILWLSLKWSAPAFLIDKTSLRSPEAEVNRTFGLQETDSPGNIPGFGVAEFGAWGAWILAVAETLGVAAIGRMSIAVSKHSKLGAVVMVGAMVSFSFAVEMETIGMITTMRDVSIIGAAFIAISKVSGLHSARRHSARV